MGKLFSMFSSSTSSRRRAAWAGAWLGALTLLAGTVPVLAQASPAGATAAATAMTAATGAPAATAAGCAHAVAHPQGPFKIASDHRTVLNANGTPFVSYGTTVPGLSQDNFATDSSYVKSVVTGKDIPKINATADHWCANTVRLQVSQHDVTQNTTVDGGSCTTSAGQAFLTKALDPEVKAAEAKKLAVVINDQTESDQLPTNKQFPNEEKDPTKATFTFWNCVTAHKESWGSGRTYAQDPDVIFDIFNEPRADAACAAYGHYNMKLWRNGGQGTCGSDQPKYQGMDAVAYHIRHFDHATNLLWVEGPGVANTLAGLDRGCAPAANCLITADLGPVVYAIHHPQISSAAQANSSTWWLEFGYLVDHPAKTGQAPVVAGEWTNLDAGDPPSNLKSGQKYAPYCWPNAPKSVANFLGYLQKIGVGMSAYQLAPPYLIKAASKWTDTTNYTDHSWSDSYCSYTKGQTAPAPPLLAAGADILNWFRQRN